MKAKTIKAIDAIIAGLEELKEALEFEANKSGDSADDEGSGKVSGRKGKAETERVSSSRKKSRETPDDDGDVGDGDDGDDGEDPEPPKKGAVASKKTGKKTAEPEVTLETVREKLTEVLEHDDLGKDVVKEILKKYGAAKAADLEEDDYEAVIKACGKKLASVE